MKLNAMMLKKGSETMSKRGKTIEIEKSKERVEISMKPIDSM